MTDITASSINQILSEAGLDLDEFRVLSCDKDQYCKISAKDPEIGKETSYWIPGDLFGQIYKLQDKKIPSECKDLDGISRLADRRCLSWPHIHFKLTGGKGTVIEVSFQNKKEFLVLTAEGFKNAKALTRPEIVAQADALLNIPELRPKALNLEWGEISKDLQARTLQPFYGIKFEPSQVKGRAPLRATVESDAKPVFLPLNDPFVALGLRKVFLLDFDLTPYRRENSGKYRNEIWDFMQGRYPDGLLRFVRMDLKNRETIFYDPKNSEIFKESSFLPKVKVRPPSHPGEPYEVRVADAVIPIRGDAYIHEWLEFLALDLNLLPKNLLPGLAAMAAKIPNLAASVDSEGETFTVKTESALLNLAGITRLLSFRKDAWGHSGATRLLHDNADMLFGFFDAKERQFLKDYYQNRSSKPVPLTQKEVEAAFANSVMVFYYCMHPSRLADFFEAAAKDPILDLFAIYYLVHEYDLPGIGQIDKAEIFSSTALERVTTWKKQCASAEGCAEVAAPKKPSPTPKKSNSRFNFSILQGGARMDFREQDKTYTLHPYKAGLQFAYDTRPVSFGFQWALQEFKLPEQKPHPWGELGLWGRVSFDLNSKPLPVLGKASVFAQPSFGYQFSDFQDSFWLGQALGFKVLNGAMGLTVEGKTSLSPLGSWKSLGLFFEFNPLFFH